MALHLEVLVKLPDGTFQYLPIAIYGDGNKVEVREFDTRREAYDWAEFILPERLRLG